MDPATPVPKFLLEDDRPEATFVGHVDPVIQPVDWQIDRVLRVGKGKSGQHRLTHVSPAVSIAVFQVKKIRSGRDQNAFFPAHYTRGQDQSVGEDEALVGQTVTIPVEEKTNSPDGLGIQWITPHFNHIDPSIFVDLHGHRISNQRFCRKHLDLEAGGQLKCVEGGLRTVGRTVIGIRSLGLAAGEPQQRNHGEPDPLHPGSQRPQPSASRARSSHRGSKTSG